MKFVPMIRSPLIVSPDLVSLVAISFVTVVAKLGSFPRAAANSFKVSSIPGALSKRLAMLVST